MTLYHILLRRSEMSVYFFTQNERRIKHYEKDYEAIAYGCSYPYNVSVK